ncbi:Golgi transport complex subunit COG4 NDAI_0A04830 [Naumovozyma dairenensis CBS 421]|uniref:Conserved oligomeric Golgi complex subunit 4 n=1 Tax=Naumovozyma dairenensis (strain ATCC 10597 / BCRC 20456 / CBS 421 / NBRC 0211 / NRRL Y-12639) TaxID=1071378 RepID=G0W4A1_NAUDC|nr:hypothetical protein NDAI_0A04830 [Naumovozyma dairenensis CBS 421]CCD22639.1 hypothetical protein NDAI_0A04830 [Naumovozyma dairenensis CBS 421]
MSKEINTTTTTTTTTTITSQEWHPPTSSAPSSSSLMIDSQLSKNLAKYSLLLEKLSTSSQVEKLSTIVAKDHQSHLANLNDFIQESQLNHNKQIRKLELQRTDLTTVLTKYNSILSNIQISNINGQLLNKNITSIDNENILVSQTLQFIKNIRTLKNNIILIDSALKEKDYQVAGKAIKEIKLLPNHETLINSEFAKKVIPSSTIQEEPAILIDNWCRELTTLFKEKFITAAQKKDIDELTLMFQMFPMVGQDHLGLELYSKYVCDIIANESRKILTFEKKNLSNLYYSNALLHLFKIVSTIINDHSKIISASYGKNYMIHVMENVEKEADLQAGLLLDIFNESRNLDQIVNNIKHWNEKYQNKDKKNYSIKRSISTDELQNDMENKNNNTSTIDNSSNKDIMIPMNQLSTLINEFSQILQNWSMYSRFFSVRWNEFSDIKTTVLTPPKPIGDSKFRTKLVNDSYLESFEILIMYHLQKSFNNSIALEELPSLNELIQLPTFKPNKDESLIPITSVLEDLSILIRKNLISNVNSGQFDVLNKFIDNISIFIQNEFLVKFMQNKIKSLQPKIIHLSSLKKYSPKIDDSLLLSPSSTSQLPTRSNTPVNNQSKNTASNTNTTTNDGSNMKLSNLRGFDFRGAAASAFTNIQSNLQTVVVTEETDTQESILALHHYLIYINTLYFTKTFIHKLLIIEIIDENPKLLPDNFPFLNNSGTLREKLITCENKIFEQTDKLIKWTIKYLFQNFFLSKIRILLTNLFVNNASHTSSHSSSSSFSHKRTDSRNNNTNNNELFYVSGIDDYEDMTRINEFLKKWQQLFIPFQNVLQHEAYNQLLSFVVEFMINLLEKRIWLLQVNELGATKLDRELSIFIGTVCGLNYKLREKFTKLTQIVLLLGFDDDDFNLETGDIKDDVGEGIDWVLSPQERISARNLKIDKRI